MFELSRIFLPVDFSLGSRTALALARRLASPTNATLEMVHAAAPIPAAMRAVLFPYAGLGSDEVVLAAELRDNTAKALSRHLRLKREKGDRVSTPVSVMYDGADISVATSLRSALSESDAQLVVMGANGESGGEQGSMGSTAERLLAASTRPVFLARDMGGNVTFRRFAVALDLSPTSSATYFAALELAIAHEASLDILVAVPLPASQGAEGVLASALKGDPAALKKRGQRELEKTLTRLREELQVNFPLAQRRRSIQETTEVLVGDPEAELVRTVAEREIDVLVIGRGGGDGSRLPQRMGRRARTLAAVAPCHVLVVP